MREKHSHCEHMIAWPLAFQACKQANLPDQVDQPTIQAEVRPNQQAVQSYWEANQIFCWVLRHLLKGRVPSFVASCFVAMHTVGSVALNTRRTYVIES